uniref:Kinesin motor domain-containing protein n=1 Tax=Caenorhabditis tropicalis TaxID=1561998 RepID=A0A1I7UAI1_9PELO
MIVPEEESAVKVAIRVRPFNKRELDLKTKSVVRIQKEQCILNHPVEEKNSKTFTFDHSFCSTDPRSHDFASQETVCYHLGSGVVENAFSGYNACIFAYGQTGSGKSYTMMGTPDQPGIIPRVCNDIFTRIHETTNSTLSFKVEVSYMEIYNERVRDLLDPKKSSKALKVREHKILGPMVDGLSILAVNSFEQISNLLEEGNKSRTVAATNMNAESSRSHAVFSLIVTQTLHDLENGFSGEKVAKISLVDLAGSERAGKTGAVGKRLEEGGNINKSLTTLGMVISALAERNGKKDKFIPYRDSVLTWLLKDSLGGNSRTVMIATLSPAADNYEETLSTLRYADRAKKIVNHAIINEDPNARVIRELREEVETLRMQITQTKKEHAETEELRERLAESERLVAQMNKSWEERLKETDTLNKERQKDLAEIGISIESSGIKVEKDRFYLVNMNADPSLNELLVYYINGSAIIGNSEELETSRDSGLSMSSNESSKKDDEKERTSIVLRGLGIMRRHAKLTVEEYCGRMRLFVAPMSSECRICVNGKQITDKTLLRNGNRMLVGMNHFFKVNCPKVMDMEQSIMEDSTMFDYNDAWHEVNDANPISSAVDQYMESVTLKHQEDKKAALEQQYEAFEKYIQSLTAGGFTPSTPMTPGFGLPTPITTPTGLPPFPFPTNPKQSVKSKFFYWAQRKEEMFAESLKRLKADVIHANALVREANMISKELNKKPKRQTTYDVTLQIPASNLRPIKIKAGQFVCEPVIVVRREGMSGSQFWTVSQLESRLVDMRDTYNDMLNGYSRASESLNGTPNASPMKTAGIPLNECSSLVIDPFFESQEHHNLVGVANVFLEVLFHDLRLDYQVPIISQQGEVAGRLHVQIFRVVTQEEIDSQTNNGPESLLGKTITCRVRIKRASGLPEKLSNFVFCQYSFFNISELLVVAPANEVSNHTSCATTVIFEHQGDFNVMVTEEFMEYVRDDALSIEVWGHRICGHPEERVLDTDEKCKSLQNRWMEVTRRLEMWAEVRELNENGEWTSVEVRTAEDVATGGIYQLKQGQQRRLVVGVNVAAPDGLPISIDSITSVSIGAIMATKPNSSKSIDSYQEEDLDKIRKQWSHALKSRQFYLQHQLDTLSAKSGKSEAELDREHSLMGQWVALTEERTAVECPAPNSCIPGAPCDWIAPEGVERHIPVLFLDLNSDDMTGEMTSDENVPRIAGIHSMLPLEPEGNLLLLPIHKYDDKDHVATCSWDSSVHDSPALNVPTNSNDRVYAIVKIMVRLSHPCPMHIVLRKRICLQIYKKPSLTEKFFKKMLGTETIHRTSLYYDVVAHIPKSSQDMEDRSSLAMMAAKDTSQEEQGGGSSRSSTSSTESQYQQQTLNYIEAYTKSIQAVESMLKLDRLRQEVAITNMLTKKERLQRIQNFGLPMHSLRMNRAVSLPNAISSAGQLNGCERRSDTPMSISSSNSMARPTSLNLKPLCIGKLTSIISPYNDKLTGIIEETNSLKIETIPTRSSTVPETMCFSAKKLSPTEDVKNGNEGSSSSRFANGTSMGVKLCLPLENNNQFASKKLQNGELVDLKIN